MELLLSSCLHNTSSLISLSSGSFFDTVVFVRLIVFEFVIGLCFSWRNCVCVCVFVVWMPHSPLACFRECSTKINASHRGIYWIAVFKRGGILIIVSPLKLYAKPHLVAHPLPSRFFSLVQIWLASCYLRIIIWIILVNMWIIIMMASCWLNELLLLTIWFINWALQKLVITYKPSLVPTLQWCTLRKKNKMRYIKTIKHPDK